MWHLHAEMKINWLGGEISFVPHFYLIGYFCIKSNQFRIIKREPRDQMVMSTKNQAADIGKMIKYAEHF